MYETQKINSEIANLTLCRKATSNRYDLNNIERYFNMGLDKKSKELSKPRIKAEYEIFLLSQYKEKHENGEIPEISRTNAPTLAQKIAFAKSESERKTLLRVRNKLNDKEAKLAYRLLSSDEVITNSPNYFLTLSMDSCFDKRWTKYDRNNKTKKLYRSSLILIKKLLLFIDPSLKNKPYEEWPFFIAVMEHFDDEGNLVAPHMHILLKLDIDLQTLRAAIEDLWGNAVPEAGKNGIDLQYVTSEALPDKARYLFKHAYQDHEFKLDNGVIPEFVCKRYGWSKEAVSHDKWMLRRENFRAALAGKSMTYHSIPHCRTTARNDLAKLASRSGCEMESTHSKGGSLYRA